MKVQIITQARIGSARLPGKVLKKINGEALITLHLQRARKSKLASIFTMATTFEEGTEQLMSVAEICDFESYQGSTDDVLDRFYQSAEPHQPDYIVRLTSDCPLIDPQVIDDVIGFAIEYDLDFATNTFAPSFPDGQDVEVFKFEALESAWRNGESTIEREHVTPYIRNNSDFKGGSLFRALDYINDENYADVRMTVDEQKDFDAIDVLVNRLGVNCSWKEYADYLIRNTQDFDNQKIIRNEGYLKSLERDK